jgi:DNA-binding response OmpR family regulator
MAQILIVDDDASLVRILAHFLQKAGHTPVLASDGRSALHAVGAHPDLILLDLGLPDIRGEELLRRFRGQPHTADIPVVVVSGETDAAAMVGVDGVAAVLRKPVAGADVCRVVDAVLATRSAWGMAAAGLPADRQRAKIIFRLILEGSTPLVFQLCRLLDAERMGGRHGNGEAPTWLDIARWARRECLVDDKEAQVLLGDGNTRARRLSDLPCA